MRSFSVVALAGLCLAACVREVNARSLELEDLFRIGRVGDPQLSPDGRWVAYVVTRVLKDENRTDSDIWIVASGGGEARQLTRSPKQDRHPRWAPDSRRLAFESNRDGAFQVYVLDREGGEARALTRISTEASQPVWSADGRWIAFVSAVYPEFSELPFPESDRKNKERNEAKAQSKVQAQVFDRLLFRHWDSWVEGKRQHLFVVSPEGGDPRNVTPGDRDAVPTSSTFSAGDDFDFSPDGRELAYTATPEPAREEAWRTDHQVMVVDLESGRRRSVTQNPAADGYPRYSPDGRYLAWRAQSKPGYEADRWQLMVQDRSSGTVRSVTPGWDSWVESFAWALDSRSLFFEGQEGPRKPVWSVRVDGGPVRKVYEGGVNGELSVGRERLVFTQQSLSRPAEVVSVDVSGGGRVELTRVNAELFAGLDVVTPESVIYRGDGVPVQMWILKPPGFDPGRRYPLVYWVHGGPQGAFLDAWSYRWNAQLWAAQGYVLALPNPRGSTGFGQKFVEGVTRDWGGEGVSGFDARAGLDGEAAVRGYRKDGGGGSVVRRVYDELVSGAYGQVPHAGDPLRGV